MEKRSNKVDNQWQMRIQQAEYNSELAQRRYEEVDPSNRLVAFTLEKKWNESLLKLNEVKSQYQEFIEKQNLCDLSKYRQEILKLNSDFPKIWTSLETNAKDKKRILRLLINTLRY